MSEITVDPISLQVIGGALDTIAKEMGHVLYRMSYSSIIRESQDLGAGLFDRDFNTLCESDSTPMHIGSLPAYLRGIKETLHGDWEPGDIVIHNHPYYGASHSPDIAIVAPVFYDGELFGFSANTAHHVDIGAATPGLIIDVADVYAEGMLFKGIKLYERGVLNRALWQFIETNTRAPGQVMGDLEAQLASAELGVRRFTELLDSYGRDTVRATCNQLMDYSERVLRSRLAQIPDGEYSAEGFLDDDGRNRGKTLPVKVTVRITGDSAEVDLTGSADQVPTAFNVPFEGSTKVACYYAFRALLMDTYTHAEYVPQNEGSFRPISVVAPAGSIFNPDFPNAAEARFGQIQRVVDCIIRALAPVIPQNITAGNSAALSFAAYSGLRDSGDIWVFLEVNEGSYGGRPTSDGPDSIDCLMANTRNNPIEDLGMHLPLFCDYLTELGAGSENYLETQERRARVGNINAYGSARTSLTDVEVLNGRLVVTAKGLARKHHELLDNLFEVIQKVRFDELNRLGDLITQSRTDSDASITDRGHQLAMHGASRGLSRGGLLDNLWDGPASISFIQALDTLCVKSKDAIETLAESFEGIRAAILSAPWQTLVVAEEQVVPMALAHLQSISSGFTDPRRPSEFVVTDTLPEGNCAWIANTQVNFCAKAYLAVPEAHADAAALAVLAHYLQDGYLHPAIREKGGAYGAGAQFDPESATFRFYSYRDPRISDTLQDFDRSLIWLRTAADPQRLEESILGVIRSLDTPRTPAGAAILAFYNEMDGRSREFRMAHRDAVLGTTFNRLLEVAERYLGTERGAIAVITNNDHEQEVDALRLTKLKL